MVMAGYEYMKKRPFKRVYFTGTVRDMLHRKMSKSLGNSPDALELIDKFGADGVRVGMLMCSAAGNDLMFEEQLTEQGRNFSNKIWNAFRLIQSWKKDLTDEQFPTRTRAIQMFEARMNEAVLNVESNMKEYRLSEALTELYRLFWDDFSAWLLELIKPREKQKMDSTTYAAVENIFDSLLLQLHPFMPFITEELWHNLGNCSARQDTSIMQQRITIPPSPDKFLLKEFELLKAVVSGIRSVRQSKGIPMRDSLTLLHRGNFEMSPEALELLAIMSSVNIHSTSESIPQNCAGFMVGTIEFFIPLGDKADHNAERAKIGEEINYYEGLRQIIIKKLENPNFINKAPSQVVDAEKKKLEDTEMKLAALRNRL